MYLSGKTNKTDKNKRWLCTVVLFILAAAFMPDRVDGSAAVIRREKTGQGAQSGYLSEPDDTPAAAALPEAADGLPDDTSAGSGPDDPYAVPDAVSPSVPDAADPPSDITEPQVPSGPAVSPEPEQNVPLRASVRQPAHKKQAVISWKKAKGAVSYRIYRSDKKNGSYKKIADRSAGSSSYTDKNVSRGNYYYYRVTAVLAGGGKRESPGMLFACQMKSVPDVELIRYSTSSIKVTWKKNSRAACYKVYYAKQKKGKYRLAGTTTDNWYRVENLRNNQTYYFQVKSCASRKDSGLDSVPSAPVSMTTRTYERTTVFAGDSITTGLAAYGTMDAIDIGGYKEVIASVGLNTTTFRTRREFSGLSALGRLIADHPYRAYIMLGTNEIEYRGCGDIIDGYEEIVRSIQTESPDTDIVLLAVPPVTASARQKSKGFEQIPALNAGIRNMAAGLGVRYFDHTQALKDSGGCLQDRYAAKDGIHWTIAAYRLFAEQIEIYDRSLD